MVALLRGIRNEQSLLKSKESEASVSGRTLFINNLLKTRYQCWIGEGIPSTYPRNHPSSTLSIGNRPILESALPF